MRGEHGNHAKASRQHRWKPGGSVGSTGHVKVRVGKGHPLADPNGYAYEHLVVWVAAGRPRPQRGEIIHHVNEDKTDNRIENLRLMTRAEHSQMHSDAMPDAWVETIRECYADGNWTMKKLAEHFECSIQRVSKIVRGEVRLAAGGPISVRKRAAGRLLDGVQHDGVPLMPRLTDEQKEKILTYAEMGKKGPWITAQLGLKAATVNYQMLRGGYDPWDASKRSRSPESQPGAFSASEDARILELGRTMGASRIAKKLRRSKTSVLIRLMTLEVRAEAALNQSQRRPLQSAGTPA